MKGIAILLFLILCLRTQAQITCQFVTTNDKQINNAIVFYKSYLQAFENGNLVDYKKFWSAADCQKYKTPDPVVYSISSAYPTYNFARQKTIFYARKHIGYVHLKTLLTNKDSLDHISVAGFALWLANLSKKLSLFQATAQSLALCAQKFF